MLGVHCDGGMRALLTVPADKIHVSRSLSTEQLALVEMLCIGRHAINRAGIVAGEEALVLGAGPIGLSVVQFLQAEGARVIVADISEDRLAFCRDGLGVEQTLLVRPEKSIEARLRDRCEGELPVAVFDATGNAGSMRSTFDLVAHGGRIVFVGFCRGEITFDDPNFLRREITLLSNEEIVTHLRNRSLSGALQQRGRHFLRSPCVLDDEFAQRTPRVAKIDRAGSSCRHKDVRTRKDASTSCGHLGAVQTVQVVHDDRDPSSAAAV